MPPYHNPGTIPGGTEPFVLLPALVADLDLPFPLSAAPPPLTSDDMLPMETIPTDWFFGCATVLHTSHRVISSYDVGHLWVRHPISRMV